MNVYQIIAEYGPVAADHIMFYVQCDNEDEALQEAIEILKKDYASYWPRIGESNIHIHEYEE